MIKSAIYLIAICLVLTACEQASVPNPRLSLATQGVLSADLSSDGDKPSSPA